MIKSILLIVTTILTLAAVSGCDGTSQQKHDLTQNEKETLKQGYQTTKQSASDIK